jgi:hypothetical protein
MHGKSYDGPVRLLVYVSRDGKGDHGPILHYDGPQALIDNLAMIGHDISDHEVPTPSLAGLLVFEGWHEPDAEDMPLRGEWRYATFWEVTRLRYGFNPWKD